MSDLPYAPLEITDFSGGMTDYYLQGDPKRFQVARNFLITSDKKLELRYGSWGLDENGNHKLPGSALRIGSLFTFDNEREMLVQQARKIFYLGPNWTEIRGPEGAEAIGGGSPYDAFSSVDWNSHVYFTSAGGGLPGKLYKDESGVFQVRTAGLPLPKAAANFTNDELLFKCIQLANDLRSSMVQHIKDTTNLHDEIDKWSLSYFEAQSFQPIFDDEYPGPQPAPTPAPAATNEATLFALVAALNAAYEHHGADGDSSPYYHREFFQGPLIPPKGPYKTLSDNTTPTIITQAAAQLDELRTRWYWHRFALFTHSARNLISEMDLYPVTAPAIGTINLVGVPYVQPNYTEIFRYVAYLQNTYNSHVSNGEYTGGWLASYNNPWHNQLQNDTRWHVSPFGDPTDLDTAYLIIYYIWAMYGLLHYPDSNTATHGRIYFDSVAGSPDITNVADDDGSIAPQNDWWVYGGFDMFQDPDPNNRRAAQVISSGSGTATLSKPLDSTQSNGVVYSASFYHGNFVNSTPTPTTTSPVGIDENLDPQPTSGLSDVNNNLPTTIEAWVAKAQTVFTALKYHVENPRSHFQGQGVELFLTGNGPFYLPQISSYGYAFIYKVTYKNQDGIEFLTQGPPVFVGPIETAKQAPIGTQLASGFPDATDDPLSESISTRVTEIAAAYLSNLPELTNTSLTNYDVANVKLEIYRTQDGGNTFYLLGEVDNGETTFTDLTSDTVSSPNNDALDVRQTLYTTGGVVANDPPPYAKYIHILQNTAYYGFITDTGQTFKGRILQSVPGSPDAVPADFYDEVEDELMGLTSARNNLIALGRNSVYRMGGSYTLLGQGLLTHERISDAMGCISSASVVQTEIGVFYAGTDGFYYTDGYQLIKISLDIDKTYASRTQTENQRSRISGTYDKLTRRIWWTMQSEPNGPDCDEAFVFYLNYGVKPGGVFTSMGGSSDWAPTSILFFNGDMIRGDRRGLIFKHAEYLKSDPKVPTDLTTPLADWQRAHIPFQYRSCSLDFGTLAKGNWVSRIHLVGANKGNVNVSTNAIADNNYFSPSNKRLAPMVYRPNMMWGDPGILWGDPEAKWKYDGKFDQWRRFPAGNLRAQLKQIEFSPARVGVYSYDEYPELCFADVVVADNEVTIQSPSGFTAIVWPIDVVGMYIAFEVDNYEEEFLITSVADAVLTYSGSIAADLANQKWVIRGYQKEAGLSMIGYVIHFANVGERGEAYGKGAGRGENA